MKKQLATPDPAGRYLIPLVETAKAISISRENLYRLIRNSKFPAPIKQGNRSYFQPSDIHDYLDKLNRTRR